MQFGFVATVEAKILLSVPLSNCRSTRANSDETPATGSKCKLERKGLGVKPIDRREEIVPCKLIKLLTPAVPKF